MASRGVMAIDFGTANTYFCKCPDDQVSPKGVDFDGSRAGLDTAILYREGKEPLIGHTAFEEFGEATADERRRYTFRAQFKPTPPGLSWQSYHLMTKSEYHERNDSLLAEGYTQESVQEFTDASDMNRVVATWSRKQ